MKIALRYWGQLRQLAGTGEESFELSRGTDLAKVLRQAAAKHGEDFARLVFGAGDTLRPSLVLVLRDQQIDPDTAPPLEDGDTLTLLPPIAGG